MTKARSEAAAAAGKQALQDAVNRESSRQAVAIFAQQAENMNNAENAINDYGYSVGSTGRAVSEFILMAQALSNEQRDNVLAAGSVAQQNERLRTTTVDMSSAGMGLVPIFASLTDEQLRSVAAALSATRQSESLKSKADDLRLSIDDVVTAFNNFTISGATAAATTLAWKFAVNAALDVATQFSGGIVDAYDVIEGHWSTFLTGIENLHPFSFVEQLATEKGVDPDVAKSLIGGFWDSAKAEIDKLDFSDLIAAGMVDAGAGASQIDFSQYGKQIADAMRAGLDLSQAKQVIANSVGELKDNIEAMSWAGMDIDLPVDFELILQGNIEEMMERLRNQMNLKDYAHEFSMAFSAGLDLSQAMSAVNTWHSRLQTIKQFAEAGIEIPVHLSGKTFSDILAELNKSTNESQMDWKPRYAGQLSDAFNTNLDLNQATSAVNALHSQVQLLETLTKAGIDVPDSMKKSWTDILAEAQGFENSDQYKFLADWKKEQDGIYNDAMRHAKATQKQQKRDQEDRIEYLQDLREEQSRDHNLNIEKMQRELAAYRALQEDKRDEIAKTRREEERDAEDREDAITDAERLTKRLLEDRRRAYERAFEDEQKKFRGMNEEERRLREQELEDRKRAVFRVIEDEERRVQRQFEDALELESDLNRARRRRHEDSLEEIDEEHDKNITAKEAEIARLQGIESVRAEAHRVEMERIQDEQKVQTRKWEDYYDKAEEQQRLLNEHHDIQMEFLREKWDKEKEIFTWGEGAMAKQIAKVKDYMGYLLEIGTMPEQITLGEGPPQITDEVRRTQFAIPRVQAGRASTPWCVERTN